ncbi:hypothetical protein L3073_12895 [Ancylomarina sp. DW003]|nr:hypothetical protein [Ancylomarina sp. DW003]MDE5423109.1 hypothetical protein [Ancylomarina sp. DW003]
MKTIGFKHLLIPICVSISLGAGCDKDDDKIFLELKTGSDQTQIKKLISGIEFKYCLLDEAKNSKVVFNHGENISFYFSITNKNDSKITIDGKLINSDFFIVKKNSSNESIGKPWTSVFCEYSLSPQEFNLEPMETLELIAPWNVSIESSNSYFPFCFEQNNPIMPIDLYFSEFTIESYKRRCSI